MWMLYCFTGPSLDCQREAGGELGGWADGGFEWCVRVLTRTFCGDIQLDDWCSTEDRTGQDSKREPERVTKTLSKNEDILNRQAENTDTAKKASNLSDRVR